MGDAFTDGVGQEFEALGHGGRFSRQVDDERLSARAGFGAAKLPTLSPPLRFTTDESPISVLLAVTQTVEQPTNTLAVVAAGSGALELRFVGETGRTYRLQASTDLFEWVDIATNTASGGVIEYSDPDWSNRQRWFYRMVTR